MTCSEIVFFGIKEKPLPKNGEVIVSVTVNWPNIEGYAFTCVVYCDEMGAMDKTGDYFMYAKEITHWAHFPSPILTSYLNN